MRRRVAHIVGPGQLIGPRLFRAKRKKRRSRTSTRKRNRGILSMGWETGFAQGAPCSFLFLLPSPCSFYPRKSVEAGHRRFSSLGFLGWRLETETEIERERERERETLRWTAVFHWTTGTRTHLPRIFFEPPLSSRSMNKRHARRAKKVPSRIMGPKRVTEMRPGEREQKGRYTGRD